MQAETEDTVEQILKSTNLDNILEISTGNDVLDYYLIFGKSFGLDDLKKKLEEWSAIKSEWSGAQYRVDNIKLAIAILERKMEYGKNQWGTVEVY